jgi:hypothetical protein
MLVDLARAAVQGERHYDHHSGRFCWCPEDGEVLDELGRMGWCDSDLCGCDDTTGTWISEHGAYLVANLGLLPFVGGDSETLGQEERILVNDHASAVVLGFGFARPTEPALWPWT